MACIGFVMFDGSRQAAARGRVRSLFSSLWWELIQYSKGQREPKDALANIGRLLKEESDRWP